MKNNRFLRFFRIGCVASLQGICAIFILLAGCSRQPSQETTSTAEPVLTPTKIELPTAASTREVKIQQKCLDVRDTPQTDLSLEGLIVLGNSRLKGITSFDQVPRLLMEADESTIDSFAHVSPDRRWLAYVHTSFNQDGKVEEAKLVLVDQDGKLINSLEWEKNWGSISGWINNDRISIIPTDMPPGSIVLLDPFSSQVEEIVASFPDVYDQYPPPQWEDFAVAIYDSTLTRVAYLRDPFSKDGLGVVLWDLKTNQSLWQFDSSSVTSVTPKWSPDGSLLAVSGSVSDTPYNFELMIIDRNGRMLEITNLAEVYPVTLINGFSWSPRGQRIALWLETRNSSDEGDGLETLALLDLGEQEIFDYCIPGSVLGAPSPPIWSPDGDKLLIHNIYDLNASRVILVDVEKNTASQIASDLRPVGWLSNSP